MSRRSYPVPPPGFPPFAAPGPAGIEEEEEVDPQAHYTCLDQVWDQYTMGNWLTRKPKPPSLQASANTRLIFKAYNRVYGDFGPSIDDHTWIDFKSQPLIDLLRSEESLKGAGALLQNQPGIDARDLFLRLPRLKELAIEPTIEDEPAPAPTSPSAEYQTPEAASASVVSLGPESATAPTIPTLGLVRSAKNDPPVPTAAPVLTAPPGPPATVGSLLSAPEQLYLLVKFIENHFKDTVEEFERVKQDGYMSFKLLWMLCVPGSVVEVEDEATGHPTGVKIGSWGYGSDGRTLTVQGLKYVWDGKVYKQAQIPVGVLQFKGLMKLGQVPIKALSDQVHQQLIERGKLYEKFAGVQHLRYDSFVIVKTACGYVKRPSKGRVMVDSAGFYRFNLNAPGGPRDMYCFSAPWLTKHLLR
ncbi:hypothetical protein FRC12_015304 [Ceratobasidium sp. 428]|nr:hypothetical protein FRC12_015304 [Ceratobasidium sp. 428]